VAAPRAGEQRSILSASSGLSGQRVDSGGEALPTSSLVASFTGTALVDGLSRAADHFAADASTLDGFDASEILPWLRSHNVTALVTPYAPVGPVRDRLDRLSVDLAAEGITLSRVMRTWDTQAWPHAARGFFSFRERIPALIREQQFGS